PVKMAQKMPKLEGAALERELARYFDDGSSAEGSQQDIEKAPQPDGDKAQDGGKAQDVEKVAVDA
ncbi:hypothetical protein O0I10_013219, partial [Lichtheimia ornata]